MPEAFDGGLGKVTDQGGQMRKSFEIFGIVSSAVLLAACSTAVSAEPADAPPAPPVIEYVSWDIHGSTAEALAGLVEWIRLTTTTVAVQRPATRVTSRVMPDGDIWDRLAECESNGDWSANTGNGYGGGLQFAHGSGWSTWRAFGGTEFAADPWDATREQQIIVAERVLERSGWNAWPGCSRSFGWL